MVRLQKAIADAGLCSRRKAESLIAQGRVKVNGQVVREQGVKVNLHVDQIEVDGKRLNSNPRVNVYYLLNKPVGVVTSVSDPQGRPTVVGLIPTEHRIFPVGRLDVDTEGLLLLTNDGELAYRLTHPSYEVKKVYEARLKGDVSDETVRRLAEGVVLEDGKTWPARVRVLRRDGDATLVSIAIHEGRNRQVRRMAEAVGHPVVSLRRVGFGRLTLGKLPVGGWRRLLPREVKQLYADVGLS